MIPLWLMVVMSGFVGAIVGVILFNVFDHRDKAALYQRWHDEECKKRHEAEQDLCKALDTLDRIRGVLDGDVLEEFEEK